MNFTVAIGTKKNAFFQFSLDPIPRTIRVYSDRKIFLLWIEMVEMQRARTLVVPAYDAGTSHVLDRSELH